VVWGTPEAFAHHGPILNTPDMLGKRGYRRAPELTDYPAEYQLVYRATADKAFRSVAHLQRLIAQVLANATRAAQPPEPVAGDWWQR